jgi:Uncharacterized conserved protein
MLRGGVPCVRGTRLPVAQVLAELADHGEAVRELAQELDQDVDAVREAVRWAASQIDRPFVTRCPAVGPYGHQCEYEEGHHGRHGASETGWTAPRTHGGEDG